MTTAQDEVFKMFEQKVLRLSLSTKGKSSSTPEKHEFLGNAFIVYYHSGTCLVMTCNHCLLKEAQNLKKNQKYRLDFSRLSIPGFEADVAFRDAARDLAILRVDGLQQALDSVNFVDSDTILPSGVDVVLLAFYQMDGRVLEEPGTMEGKIVGLPDTSSPRFELIRANYTSKKGTSGAPVVMVESMAVAGVQCEGEYAAKYAISPRCVEAALRDWTKSDEDITILGMLTAIALYK